MPTFLADVVFATPDAILDSIAGLSSNGLVARTAAGSAAARTITGTTNQVSVSNGDGGSGNPTLSLPQDHHTGAAVQYARIGLGAAPVSGVVLAIGGLTKFVGNGTIDTGYGGVQFADVAGTGLVWASGTYNFYSVGGTTLWMSIDSSGNLQMGTSGMMLRLNGTIKLASLADASAANESLYYSTTQGKVVWKNSSGVVNNLY